MNRAAWTTEQEKLLLLRLEQGKKVKEIAAELNVSPKRVSNKIQILKNQKLFSSEVEKAKPIPEAAELFTKNDIPCPKWQLYSRNSTIRIRLKLKSFVKRTKCSVH